MTETAHSQVFCQVDRLKIYLQEYFHTYFLSHKEAASLVF